MTINDCGKSIDANDSNHGNMYPYLSNADDDNVKTACDKCCGDVD